MMSDLTDLTPKKGNPPANWREQFLKALRVHGNVSYAARSARITRQYVYEVQKSDPDFAEQWKDAQDEASDGMEKAAWDRAVKGTKKPIYAGKEHVGDVREYSDTLLMFLLKAARPEKFRERFDHSHHSPDSKALVIQSFEDALDQVYGDQADAD